MKVQGVSHPGVNRGNDEGVTAGDEADMTDESFVENGVDRRAVVVPPLRFATNLSSIGR